MYGKDLSIYELPTSLELKSSDFFAISKDITTRRTSNKVSYGTILDTLKKDITINEGTVTLTNQYVINNRTLSTQRDLNTELLKLMSKLSKSKVVFYHHELDTVNPNQTFQSEDDIRVYCKSEMKLYTIKTQRLIVYDLNADTLYVNVSDLDNVIFKIYSPSNGLTSINFNIENKDHIKRFGVNEIDDDFILRTNISMVSFGEEVHGFKSFVNERDFIRINTETQTFSFIKNNITHSKEQDFYGITYTYNDAEIKINNLNKNYLLTRDLLNHPTTINSIYSLKLNNTYLFANSYGTIDISESILSTITDENTKIIGDYTPMGLGENATQSDLNKLIISLIKEMNLTKSYIDSSTTHPSVNYLLNNYRDITSGDIIYFVNLPLPKKFVYLGNNEFAQEIFSKFS